MGGAWGPEHLAGEAVLEFHHLLVDDDLPGARRRPVAGAAGAVCTQRERESKVRTLGKVNRHLFYAAETMLIHPRHIHRESVQDVHLTGSVLVLRRGV